MPTAGQLLGDLGEQIASELLRSRGYGVKPLQKNAPTYDLEVSIGMARFQVSVKVSREKQHVRLGSRNSVVRLTDGNFVFAFMPILGKSEICLDNGEYTLLILPAKKVRTDGLSVHDKYWSDRGKSSNEFSVMVKGYGSHHRHIWPEWMSHADAWHLLPQEK